MKTIRDTARKTGLARSSELWSVLRRCRALLPSPMEESMCWEIDYKFLVEQKKAQETRNKQQRRAVLVDQLLNDAYQQDNETKVDGTPDKEVAPAKYPA